MGRERIVEPRRLLTAKSIQRFRCLRQNFSRANIEESLTRFGVTATKLLVYSGPLDKLRCLVSDFFDSVLDL